LLVRGLVARTGRAIGKGKERRGRYVELLSDCQQTRETTNNFT
jgi:hypothetical protein